MSTARIMSSKRRLELDEEAAMAVLEKGPPRNERVGWTPEQVARINEIMERIQRLGETVDETSDVSEDLDESIYSPRL